MQVFFERRLPLCRGKKRDNFINFNKGEHMAKGKPETRLEGRNAITGKFESVQRARQHPRTSVVERIPLPGKGRK